MHSGAKCAWPKSRLRFHPTGLKGRSLHSSPPPVVGVGQGGGAPCDRSSPHPHPIHPRLRGGGGRTPVTAFATASIKPHLTRNSKSEFRDPKQIRNPKRAMPETRHGRSDPRAFSAQTVSNFPPSVIRICFEFRAPSFGFRSQSFEFHNPSPLTPLHKRGEYYLRIRYGARPAQALLAMLRQ
jgi:hypothetical protein